MKRILIILFAGTVAFSVSAQDSTGTKKSAKEVKREERRQKINSIVRQEEEGVLVYNRQNFFGLQFRTNGYGILYETGRMKTTRKTTTYDFEFTEIKHPKEERLPQGGFSFGNPYIYGKINNFYQLKFGIGQQYILGEKGNKNGVTVSAVYNSGISLGMLKPYYLQVEDSIGNIQTIKYTQQDSALFVGGFIHGGGGLGKGWGEIKFKPGIYGKAGLRFDYGRFNEVVSSLEVGVSLEVYAQKIPIMLFQDDKRFFFQGYVAIEFGRRK